MQESSVDVGTARAALLQARAQLARIEEDLEAVEAESQDASVVGASREEVVLRIQTCQAAETEAQATIEHSTQVRCAPDAPGAGCTAACASALVPPQVVQCTCASRERCSAFETPGWSLLAAGADAALDHPSVPRPIAYFRYKTPVWH